MIKFTTRLLLKNKVLWAWPLLITVIAIGIGFWGDVIAAENGAAFLIKIGKPLLPAGPFIIQVLSLVVFICIIGLPTHLSENLSPERTSLLLSKPVSRTDFFLSDFIAMLTVSLLYTLLTIAILAILVIVKAGIFPVPFFLSLLCFTPLYLLAYYITIVFLLVITNSYLGSVILGYILTGFSGILLSYKEILDMLGFNSSLARGIATAASYLIPSSAGVQQLMGQTLTEGFTAFNGGLLLFVLASFLPFFLLGFYFMRRKQF